MIRKLCVAGCSVSDYTDVDLPYGKILATDLGVDYLHEGAGAGSNFRIWRRITNHILNNTITEEDVVVIQYTEIVRNEFWSALPNPVSNYTAPPADLSHDGGRVIRWKPSAHTWQPYDEEKQFLKEFEQYFVSPRFSEEEFRVNNYNFQQMLKNHKIRTIFLNTTRSNLISNYVIDHFQPYQIFEDTHSNPEYNLRENDTCHFSEFGHRYMASELKSHIEKLGWI